MCVALAMVNAGCKKSSEEGHKRGQVKGVARKQNGEPLSNVRITADHSIFFNSGITTQTNNSGEYSLKVPEGSWYVFAQHQVDYNGKQYTFYLHPDNATGFGGEGAVRNFEWRLAGEMQQPLSGNYGGLVTFDNYPGEGVLNEDAIEFTFQPVGPLIDGSNGTAFTTRSPDAYQIKGIPVGRYRVSATYQGKALLLRRWNSTSGWVSDYELNFEPQIAGQCDNCAMLEYRQIP